MATEGDHSRRTIDVVAIAASAGGLEAVTAILRTLREDFPAAVIVAMHLSDAGVRLRPYSVHSALQVTLAEQDVPIKPGRVYWSSSPTARSRSFRIAIHAIRSTRRSLRSLNRTVRVRSRSS